MLTLYSSPLPFTQEEFLESTSAETLQIIIDSLSSFVGPVKITLSTGCNAIQEFDITSTIEELKILQVTKKLDRK